MLITSSQLRINIEDTNKVVDYQKEKKEKVVSK